MIRIVAAALAILALMILIKDGRVLRNAGLIGSCDPIQTTTDGSQWEVCRPGKLEGQPDLSKKSCTRQGTNGDLEYWRCPAAVGGSPVR